MSSDLHIVAAVWRVIPPPPDLILLDIMRPDVDGLTLCKALKAQSALVHPPIWLLSAAHSDTTRELACGHGVSESFAKADRFCSVQLPGMPEPYLD